MSDSALFLHLSDRPFAEAIARVNAANPFLPTRIAAEREALGDAFVEAGADWNTRPPAAESHINVRTITARCDQLIRAVSAQAASGRNGMSAPDQTLYEEVVGYWLYQTYAARFDEVILAALDGRGDEGRVSFYPAFKADVERCLNLPGLALRDVLPVPHLFACAFQIRRAFHAIFRSLVGGSAPMAALRSQIWQSIFTHDLLRYRRGLYATMSDFSTLITGPSGTGKELVARAIALSRYLAFEPKRGSFGRDFAQGFFALNLAALSPTLIESELFGHRRGAFTGALGDRAGWMEVCPPTGAVFLDEIGEVDPAIQVKLLRVLQSRRFEPLGGTESRKFEGKVIAATNRDLPAEIRAGRFREDFYYRLCSDQIATPALREQLDDRPSDLEVLVAHISARFLADEDERARFVRDAVRWIERSLGGAYAWPGNFRELEQCVRSLLLRGAYQPANTRAVRGDDWSSLIEAGSLTADQLLRRYIRQTFERCGGNIEETARRLDVDRRTVKARL